MAQGIVAAGAKYCAPTGGCRLLGIKKTAGGKPAVGKGWYRKWDSNPHSR